MNTVSPAFIMTPLVAEMIATVARGRGITPQEAQAQFLANNRPHIELRRPYRIDCRFLSELRGPGFRPARYIGCKSQAFFTFLTNLAEAADAAQREV